MSKKYKFTLSNYFTEDELSNVAPIIENYVNFFGDDTGTATLDLRDDVHVITHKDEGAVLHMIIDNDFFTALPKSLTKAKEFAKVFITAMAKKVDEKKKISEVNAAKTSLEDKAETDLLSYIAPQDNAPATTDSTTTVKVNGEEITDPDEKKKVIDQMDSVKAKMDSIRAKMEEDFSKTFKNFFDSYLKF